MLSGSLVTTSWHTQVADGGKGLQIWRVAANILNEQWRTAEKGWSSSLVIGRGTITPHPKNPKCYTGHRTWKYSSNKYLHIKFNIILLHRLSLSVFIRSFSRHANVTDGK
jgi:hypothetical protein